MKIKEEKGITLVTLVVAVSILILLSSMLIYNAKDSIKMRNLKMMQNDIEILDDKIDAYYIKYGTLPISILYSGAINFEPQANDSEEYYVIDLSALEGITLNYGLDYERISSEDDTIEYNDVYILNKQSHHIYYPMGIEYDGVMYYTNDDDNEIEIMPIIDISLELTSKEIKLSADYLANVSEVTSENVPIPTGYYYVGGTKNTGVVISDVEGDDLDNSKKGNQFVWVPVNQNQKLVLNVSSNEEITSIKITHPDGTKEKLDVATGTKDVNQEITMTKNGVYIVEVTAGKETEIIEKRITSLYAQDIEMKIIKDLENKKQTPDYNTIEELLTDKGYTDIEALLAGTGYSTLEEYFGQERIYVVGYEEEFKVGDRLYCTRYIDNNQNTVSVNKYGGFYIARYEAGDGTTGTAREEESLVTNELVSKKDVYVYNYIDVENAKILTAGLRGSNTNVTTQLITGAGWDRTLNWIIETGGKTEEEVIIDSSSWGNYANSTGNAAMNSGSSNINYTTGRSEYWKANNIYDLAGNEREMTQEIIIDTNCSTRGGNFFYDGNKYTASNRYGSAGYKGWAYISFRPQLYINI